MVGQSTSQVNPMSDIRYATMEDWPAVWRMSQAFYETTDYIKSFPIDEASTYELYESLVTNGFVFLATEGEEVFGMLGCLYSPFLLNTNIQIATELMWWVDAEHRKSPASLGLMDAAELEAEGAGCHAIVMSKLSTSPAVVARIYEARGYTEQDSSFVKEF